MAHRVTFDGARTFEADYARAKAWNGWAAVSFNREQADIVAAYCNELADQHPDCERVTWDEARQAYRLDGPVSAMYPEDEPEWFKADAEGLYPIGSFMWTWSVVDDDEDDIERLQALGLRP